MIRMAGGKQIPLINLFGKQARFLNVVHAIWLFQDLPSLGVMLVVHSMVLVSGNFIAKKGLTSLMN